MSKFKVVREHDKYVTIVGIRLIIICSVLHKASTGQAAGRHKAGTGQA